jgi:hypothetical protein
LPSLLPLCLLALLLLLHPGSPGQRAAPREGPGLARQAAAQPIPVTLQRTLPASEPRPTAYFPLFEDLDAGRPVPDAVATTPPPALADEQRLRGALAAALSALGGEAEAHWGTPSAVGPVLEVRWRPPSTLDEREAVQRAVMSAVGTVVDTVDRAFPGGYRTDQGAPLAAVRVVLPEQDDVLVAVRTYREFSAGESTPEQFASQWRVLSRRETAPAAVAAAAAPARLAPAAPPPREALDALGPPPRRWPARIAHFYPEVLRAAYTYQIDPDLLAAIMQQESGGQPHAVGAWVWIPHAGRYERAIGLMQVMPNEAERRGVSIDDAWDPENNIMLGARVLRDKLTVVRGDFWTRVQGYYGFGDPLSDYWLNRVYGHWLAFRDDSATP